MFSHFPTLAWKTRRKKAATSFPQFPQLLLLVLLPKKEQKECDISNELKHVTFLKSFDNTWILIDWAGESGYDAAEIVGDSTFHKPGLK